jgi:hypothetical protein
VAEAALSLIPLYGFVAGDTLGVLVLVQAEDTIADVARVAQAAAAVRVAPRERARVVVRGVPLDPRLTVAAAGLSPLDRVDVIAEDR